MLPPWHPAPWTACQAWTCLRRHGSEQRSSQDPPVARHVSADRGGGNEGDLCYLHLERLDLDRLLSNQIQSLTECFGHRLHIPPARRMFEVPHFGTPPHCLHQVLRMISPVRRSLPSCVVHW